MSPLQCLIYCSRATSSIRRDLEEATSDIVDVSIRNNSRVGVTGMLLSYDGWFLQALEGAPAAIAAVYGKIRQDPRHEQFKIIFHEDVKGRAFDGWSMCGRALSPVDNKVMRVLDGSGAMQFRDLGGRRSHEPPAHDPRRSVTRRRLKPNGQARVRPALRR